MKRNAAYELYGILIDVWHLLVALLQTGLVSERDHGGAWGYVFRPRDVGFALVSGWFGISYKWAKFC